MLIYVQVFCGTRRNGLIPECTEESRMDSEIHFRHEQCHKWPEDTLRPQHYNRNITLNCNMKTISSVEILHLHECWCYLKRLCITGDIFHSVAIEFHVLGWRSPQLLWRRTGIQLSDQCFSSCGLWPYKPQWGHKASFWGWSNLLKFVQNCFFLWSHGIKKIEDPPLY